MIGPYVLVERIGKGGMAVVYRARHRDLQRWVALKVAGEKALATPSGRKRFYREARASSRITHPNLVKLLDFGDSHGFLYIAMELLEGKTLDQRMNEENGPDFRWRCRCALDIARGVEALHHAGLIHRDLKPENIFVTDQFVKVMDLGIAKDPRATMLTEQGQLLGTMSYLPPEVVHACPPTKSYDVYQLGLVYHRLVTGKPAFPANPLHYAFMGVPLPVPGIMESEHHDSPLTPVILRCLATNPVDRYPDAGQVADHLEEIQGRLKGDNLPEPETERSGGSGPASGPLDSNRTGDPLESSNRWILSESSVRRVNWSRLLILMLANAVLLVLMLILFRKTTERENQPHMASPRPIPAPSTRMKPEDPDWFGQEGTLRLEDEVVFEAGGNIRASIREDPLLRPFVGEVDRILQDEDQVFMAMHHFHEVEFFPELALPPEAGSRVVLVPSRREDGPNRGRGIPLDPVRRILMRVRPGEPYRLVLPGQVIEFTAPPYRFRQELGFIPGSESVMVTLHELGSETELLLLDGRGRRLEYDERSRSIPGVFKFLIYRSVPGGEPLTLLALSKFHAGRFLLARISWQRPPLSALQKDLDQWLRAVDSLLQGKPTVAAEARMLGQYAGIERSSEKLARQEYREVVADGRRFLMPGAIFRLERLTRAENPGIRMGAIRALGILDGHRQVDRIRDFMNRHRDPESRFIGLEALGRIDPREASNGLLEILRSGQVGHDLHWSQTYARLMPRELDELLLDPDRAARELPSASLRLLDQIAAYMGIPRYENYLVQIPPDRAMGGFRLSIILALRLMDSWRTRERLRELAGTGP